MSIKFNRIFWFFGCIFCVGVVSLGYCDAFNMQVAGKGTCIRRIGLKRANINAQDRQCVLSGKAASRPSLQLKCATSASTNSFPWSSSSAVASGRPIAEAITPLVKDVTTSELPVIKPDILVQVPEKVKTSVTPAKHGIRHLFSRLFQSSAVTMISKTLRSIFSVHFYVLVVYHLSYRVGLRWLHKMQTVVWNKLKLQTPLPWKESILGFIEERGEMLGKIMVANYLVALTFKLLPLLGVTAVRSDVPSFVSKVAYSVFAINCLDLFMNQFLPSFAPWLAENRRQLYVIRRSLSFIIWTLGSLTVCEMISTFLRIPMASILAFGGFGMCIPSSECYYKIFFILMRP
jgi:hypothetical protein